MKNKSIKFLMGIFLLISYFNVQSQNCSINAGAGGEICEGAEFKLDGSGDANIKPGTILWTQIAGPTIGISDPTAYQPNITGATGGNTYKFRLTAVCTDNLSTFQDVVYTVKPSPTATAGTDITNCPGTYSLAANTPSVGYTGTWTIIGSNGAGLTITNSNSPTSTINLPQESSGATILEWRISDGDNTTCDGVSRITVTNIGGNPVVSAGADQVLKPCFDATTTATLDGSYGGNGFNGQEGLWELVSGPNSPKIRNVNKKDTKVNDLIEGTYVFRWTVSGPCASGTSTVSVTVPSPTGSVTSADSLIDDDVIRICHSDTNPTTEYLLVANPPKKTGETVEWTQVSGPGGVTIVNPNSPTTLVTGLSQTAGGNANLVNYTFRYTVKGPDNNSDCFKTKDVRIKFIKQPLFVELTDDGTPSECIFATLDSSGSVDVKFGINRDNTGSNTRYKILSGPVTTSNYVGIGSNSSGNSSSGKDLTLTFTEIGTYVVGVLRRPNGDVNNGCENAADEITVKISGPATNANAGSDIYVCTPTTTATLAGNTPVQGEGMWSQVSGPNTAVISDVFDRNAELSSLIAGAYVFRWSINSGPTSTIDPLDSDEVSVIISTGPPSHPANFAGTDVNVCAGSYQMQSPALLVNEAGRWTVSPSAGVTIVDDTDPKTLVMGLSPLTVYTFTYTISNACGSINDSVIVSTTGNTSPSTANAGSDICLTSGTSTTLNATAITTGEMGTWTQVSGPNTASFSDINSASTSITGLVPGNYEFKWRITNTSCPLNITEDTVNVSLLNSVPSAGADQDICGASTITMAADANPNGGGTWVQTFGPAGWTVTDITSPTAMFSNLSDGKYEFEWRVSLADCFVNDKVVFTITNTPTVASVAVPTIASCSNTATLNANPVTVGVGKWVWVSGPNTPSINDANSPTATISGLVTGTYEYKWTSSPLYPSADPTCNLGSSADLTINVVAPANAGNDQDLCAANEVLLQGTVGSTGTWSFQSSTGIDSPTPVAINANMAKATIIPGNNYVFTYTLTIPGGSSCVGSSDDVTINNALTNTASITTVDQSLCLPTSSVSVTAAEVSGTWTYRESLSQATSSAGLPSAASIGISNPNAQTTTITGLTNPGIYIFRWTTGSGDCQKLDEITITVHEAPSTADAGQAAMDLCVLDARLAATAPTSGLGTWSFVSGIGLSSGDVVFDSPNSPTSTLTLTNANAGDTAILRWTVSSGGCTPSTDDITITIVESITATLSALSSMNSCQGANNGSLSATGSGGVAPYSYNLLYATSSGGVFIDASQTDGDSDGSYTGLQPGFYKIVLTDSQNCGSVTSAEQEIIEQAQAPLPIVTNGVYCEGTAADPLSMRATGSGVLTWYDSDATTVLSASTVPSTASAGVKTYYVSNTVGVCVSAKVSVTITVNEAFSIDTQPVASTTVCKDGAVTLNVGASGGVGSLTYQWQSATSLAGPYSNVTSGTGGTTASYSPVTSTEGTLYYQVVVSNAGTGCTSVTSNKSTVIVNQVPTIDTEPAASTTVCKDGAVTLNVAASGGVGSLSYQWQSAISLAGPYSDVTSGTGGTTASYSPVTSTEGTLYYQVVVSNAGTGCTSVISSKSTVTVNALPTIDTEPAASTTVCKDGAVTLNVAASGGVGNLTYQWQSATSLAGPYSDVASGTGGTTASYSPVTSTEGTLYYQVVVSNGGTGCTSVTSSKSTVTVNALPTIDTQPAASTTVCKDGAVTLNVAASGGVGSLSYQWQSATSLVGPYSNVTSGTGGTTANYSPVTSNEGTLYYQVVVSNAGTGCTSVTSSKSTVIVNALPTIDTQPAASTTVCKDGAVTLNIVASGGVGSLSYQWQSATSLVGPYSDVTSGTGGTTANYSPVTSTEGTLYYQVVVSNAGTGCTSVTSNKSTVTVNALPTIDTQPAASTTVCKDGAVTLNVVASGGVGSLSYQWQSATSLAGPYSDVTSGTGGTTANYSPVTSNEGTLYYQVVVSNTGTGCTSVTSSKSTVTVNALPTIDTQPAASTTVCKDGAVTLNVAASGGIGSLTYQWQSATSLAGPYSDVTSGTGGTTANYSPVTSTEGTLYYQVVVSNAGTGCTSVTSNKSTVTVNALPTIDTQPAASTTVCKDGAVTLNVAASGGVGSLTYQWQSATSLAGPYSNVTSGTGGTTASYSPVTSTEGTLYYQVVVSNAGTGCTSVTSNKSTVIVNQVPTIDTEPAASTTVCKDGAVTLNVAASGGVGSLSYQWQSAISLAGPYSDVTSGTGGTTASYSPVTSTEGTLYYQVVVSNAGTGCTSVISSKSTVTVNALPTIDTEPAASTTVCKDGAVTLNVAASGGVGNLTYQWQSATSLAGPYSDVASGTGGTTASYSPVTSTEGTLYYQVVVSNGGTGCTSVTSSKSTVTVNALPTIDTQPAASTTVCKDGAVTLNVAASGGVGSLSYQWQSATSLVGPYSNVTSGTGGTTANYSPVTSNEGTLYYQVVVSNAGTGCTSVTSSKSTVIVNALPTIDTQPAASTTVCKDGAVTLNIVASGGVGSLSYQWQSATSLVGPYSDVTSGTGGTTANYSPVTSTEGTLYYQVVVSNAGTGCTSVTSNKSTVTVNALPTIDTQPAASTTVCKDGAVTLNVVASGGVGSLSYQWQSATSLAGPYSDVTSGTGGTTANYSPVTSTEGTLYYQVVVSNAGTGCTSVTSNKSTVTVNALPTIDTQPAASTTVCKDGAVTLNVAASGGVGSLTYQWQSATSLAGPYSDVTSGTGGTTANYSPVTSTEGTLYYQVVVSNAGTGCTSVTSSKSTVTVNALPTIDTQPAASTTVCKDGAVTLNVAASGGVGSLTYQWQSATSLAGPYSNVTSGTGGTTTSYSPVTSTEGTLYYQVVVSNEGTGCTSVTSNKSTVIVNQVPTIDTEPAASTTVCKDGAVTLNIVASGGVGSLSYQWQSATSLAGPYSDVTSGTGGTTASYSPVTSTEGTLYYQVIVSNAGTGCTSVISSKSTVRVNALPTIDTQPAASTTVCKDGAVTLNVAASGGVGSLSYQWQSATSLAGPYSNVTSGTGGTTASYSPVTSTEGTLYYQVVVSNTGTGCTSVTSSKSTVTVNALPTIDTQPAASTTVCKDGAVTLNVAASGGIGSLTYQWQSATSLAGPYSDVTSGTGGTTANYSPVTSTEGTLYYQVVVSNAGTGCTSVISSKSTVTVNALPTIDTQPAASTTVCKDGAVTLNVAASSGVGSLTYQWQSATSLAGPYSNVTSGTGGTTASYSPVTSTEGTLYYQVVVSNAGTGCTSVTSNKSTVIVNQVPTIDTEPAASTTVCKDGAVTLNVAASGGVGSLSYQWQSAISLAGPYSDVTSGTGGTTASYSPVTSTEGTLYYQVVVSNAGTGCTSVISSKSTVTVNALPTIDTEPAASTTVCKDGAVTLNVAASGGVGNLTYQWQSATSLAGPYSDVASGTGGTTASYSPVTSTEGTLYYQVVVSNGGTGCTSVTSSKSTVTVNALPTIDTEPAASTTVCKDGAVTLNVAASGGVGSLTYQWQSATSLAGPYSNVTSGTGGTTASYSPVTSTEGTLYYQVVVSNTGTGCTSVISSKSTVRVNALPTIDTQPAASTTVCKDGAVTLNVAASGGVGSLTYQWQSATSLAGPYSNVTSGTGGTTASYSPVTSTEGTLYYQVVVSNTGTGCTSVTSSKSTVTVNALPTIDTQPAASTTVCKDGAVTLNVAASGGIGSLSYQWQSATSLAGPYSDVTSGTGGTTANYSPVTSTEGTLYYQVVVSNAGTGCTSVTSNKSTVTVNALPTIDTQPAASTTVCKDGAVTLNVAASGGVGSLTYQWQSATSLAGPYSDVTSGTGGTTANYSPVTSTEGTLYYQVVVSNAGTGCTSVTSNKSTVTVNALPTIDTQPAASTTVCKDGAVTLNVAASGGVGSLTYQWQSATSLAGPYSDVTSGTGGTTANYSPVTSTEGTLYYQVVVSNAGTGCTSVISSKSTVIVGKCADLSLIKIVDNLTPNVGDVVTFTLLINNQGPSVANDVSVEDILPSGYESITQISNGGVLSGSKITWSDLTINTSGINLTYKATVKAPTGVANEYKNIAQITASDSGDIDSNVNNDDGDQSEDDEDSIVIIPQVVDLSLQKTISNPTPNVGDVVTFTIDLSNSGANTATGVSVEDVLPAGYENITSITNGGVLIGNKITWSNLTVTSSGLQLTYDATIKAPTGAVDEYKNIVQVIKSDQYDIDSEVDNDDGDQSEDDESSVEILLQGVDLALTKEVDNLEPRANTNVMFTITLTNNGPGVATNVEIEEVLPDGYEFVSYTASSGTYDDIAGLWLIPTLNSNEIIKLYLIVKVKSSGDYLNIVNVSNLDQFDGDSSNNSSSASVTPICLTVFNEFSPNDDDTVNSRFKIDCIEKYPNNTLEIFNRWGNLVYKKKGYDNTWDGTSNGRATVEKDVKLPVGTYYYVLSLGNNEKPIVGWLYINR